MVTLSQLKDKALSLPLKPGVYIMKNSKNEVIYVGKAKNLKNRVSSYFRNLISHSEKVKKWFIVFMILILLLQNLSLKL